MSRKKGAVPFSLFAFQDAITSVCGVVVLVTLLLALNLTKQALLENEEIVNVQRALEISQKIEEKKAELERARRPSESTDFIVQAAGLSSAEIDARKTKAEKEMEEALQEKERLEEAKDVIADNNQKIYALDKQVEELKQKIEALEEAKALAENKANDELDNGVMYRFPKSDGQTPWFVDIAEQKIAAIGRYERFDFKSDSEFLRWAKKRDNAAEYFVLIFRPSAAQLNAQIVKELEDADYKMGIDMVGEASELKFLPNDNPNNDQRSGSNPADARNSQENNEE